MTKPGSSEDLPTSAVPRDDSTHVSDGVRPPRRAVGSPSSFEVGDVLAGRFRVTAFIAQGGMGEVYEAEDLELHVRVALKMVGPKISANPNALERFRREVLLSRAVTHPNICRVFDVFHHAAPPRGETVFLTMELLQGETLAQRIARDGPLQPSEALPIVRQLADALSAAHDAGVVHRDMKAGNVLLVAPAASSDSGEGSGSRGLARAVITDFGVARGMQLPTGGLDETLTAQSELVGTPAYMSPEQVTGEETTPASDIYSLGVVLYEMLTGKRPFSGGTPLAVATKRLHEPPAPPRTHAPDLPQRVEEVVLRCLERAPAARFQRADEVGRAFAAALEVERPGRGRRALAIAGLAALLVAALAAALLLRRRAPAPAPSTGRPAVKARRSVAVLGFKNLAGRPETSWVATALTEMLASELGSGDVLRLVSGESVARARRELKLSEAETLAGDSLGRVRAALAADVVVLGSYLATGADGGDIRLNVFLQDTEAGETVASFVESGSVQRLPQLASGVGEKLRQRLGVVSPQPAIASSAVTADPEATRGYAEGLERLRAADWLAARKLLESAVARQPSYTLAHAALAEALSRLGYDGAALAEGRLAISLAAGLPRDQQLALRARVHELEGQWGQAADVYRKLFDFFPDDLEYGLKLASCSTRAGKPKDALEVLAQMRSLPAPLSGDPRLDVAEAVASQGLGDFARQREAAVRGAQRARELGRTLLMADALYQEAGACRELGDLTRAMAAAEEAHKLQQAGGNVAGAAAGLISIGILHGIQGDLERARQLNTEALELARGIGWKVGQSSALNNLGMVQKKEGDLEGALRTYREAQEVKREIGDRRGIALQLDNVAALLLAQGRLAESRESYGEALKIARETSDKARIGTVLAGLADVELATGDLPAALKSEEQAIAIDTEIGRKSSLADALAGLAEIHLWRGEAAAARGRLGEALALREAQKAVSDVASGRVLLSRVALREGKAEEAVAVATQAVERFEKDRQPDGLGRALSARAEALLALARRQEAGADVARALAATARSQSLAARVEVAVAAARAGGGKAALAPLLADVRARRHFPFELLLRQAQAQAEMASGAPGARERLVAVRAEAARKGIVLAN